MIVAKGCILYHIWLSLYTSCYLYTTVPIVLGCGCYFMSLYLYELGEFQLASYLHCALHTLVSMGACITYMELSNTGGVEDTGVLLGLV